MPDDQIVYPSLPSPQLSDLNYEAGYCEEIDELKATHPFKEGNRDNAELFFELCFLLQHMELCSPDEE